MKKQASVDPERIDDENPEWSADAIAQALPFGALPAELKAQLRGRPKAKITKERITIRLSREVVEQFRSSGAGWQTRLDAALRDWLTHNRAA